VVAVEEIVRLTQQVLLEVLAVVVALALVAVLAVLEILRQQAHLRVIMVETGHIIRPDIQEVVAGVLVE
jgi:hypothetical protein